MKTIESFLGLFFLAGGLGVFLGMRMVAAEALFPHWYLVFGDHLYVGISVLFLLACLDMDTAPFLINAGSLSLVWASPAAFAFVVGGDISVLHLTEVQKNGFAGVFLAIPSLMLLSQLATRRRHKAGSRGERMPRTR